jgi:type VI secretion system secreted protein Hcp
MYKKAFLIVVAALATALVVNSLVFTQNVKSAGPDPDIFLKVDGIQGESTDRTHRNEIIISSFDWMEAMQGTVSDAGAGQLIWSDFNFTMVTNKASPEIFLAVAKGTIIPSAKLTVRTSGGTQIEFLTWEFKDVRFTFFSESGTTSDRPVEDFGIAFSWMRMNYTQIRPNGSAGGTISEEWPVTAT